MQRCQSGRSCSLGTAVYSDVPRVRIPVSAPQQTKFESDVRVSFLFCRVGFSRLLSANNCIVVNPVR